MEVGSLSTFKSDFQGHDFNYSRLNSKSYHLEFNRVYNRFVALTVAGHLMHILALRLHRNVWEFNPRIEAITTLVIIILAAAIVFYT